MYLKIKSILGIFIQNLIQEYWIITFGRVFIYWPIFVTFCYIGPIWMGQFIFDGILGFRQPPSPRTKRPNKATHVLWLPFAILICIYFIRLPKTEIELNSPAKVGNKTWGSDQSQIATDDEEEDFDCIMFLMVKKLRFWWKLVGYLMTMTSKGNRSWFRKRTGWK